MDKKLREQRARAFDYLFDAVVVTDMQGMITDWNPGAEKLYGWARREVLGKPISILHAPEDVERITKEVFAKIDSQGHWRGEIKRLHKDGSLGWIESLVIPIFDDYGQQIGALGINRDITERVATEERLHKLAYYDQLTGLPNRTILFDRLEQMIAQARRYELLFALLFVDIDDFKVINDSAGHATGDLALKEFGRRMRAAIRDTDTAARVGGDEFVVLVSDIKRNVDAEKVAQKISRSLSKPCFIDGASFRIDASIGIAIYPTHGETRDELMSFSDNAMYEIKRQRKNHSAD